jgi:creatinine amidohydrolase
MNFRRALICIFAVSCSTVTLSAQNKFSPKWEELTATDFREAIQQAKGTRLLPFGILEKHSQHLPLGTDLLNVRYASLQAVSQEYAVVFPEYYFGQIFEAKHEPGTVAYSMDLQLHLLQETTDEMARNGCKKIIIVNGHGGNEHLLPFFAQAQLDKPHEYVVYVLGGGRSRPGGPAKKSTGADYHAGENETSNTMVSRPDLVHVDRAKNESARTRNALICRRMCIPEFGGTRAFQIIIPATAPWRQKNSASGT